MGGLIDAALYYAITIAMFTGLAACERGTAALRWTRGIMMSAVANGVFLLLSMALAGAVYALTQLAQTQYDTFGVPRISPTIWQGLPALAVVPIAIIIRDFVDYWTHRALHTRWLWPIHAIHHSDPDLNNSTSFRVHVFELSLLQLANVLLLSWLGFPPGTTASVSFAITLYNRYVHMNVDWSHGPLRKLLASPRFHQWHHVTAPESYNTNFANIFVIWDVLFRTYRVPGACHGPFGVDGMPKHNVAVLLAWPFIAWFRMLRQALVSTRDKSRAD